MLWLLIPLLLLMAWFVWRLASHRAILPCPSELSWLVEMENPLARATRSEQVIARLQPLDGLTVMDIGCGPGRVTVPLARSTGPGGRVFAVDVQPEMLAKVQAKLTAQGLEHVQLISFGLAEDLIPPASLDVAVMVMALGEIPDSVDVFAIVLKLLKPGGRFLIAESLFDPHYVRREKLRQRATRAGWAEQSVAGNVFGYNMILMKASDGSALSE